MLKGSAALEVGADLRRVLVKRARQPLVEPRVAVVDIVDVGIGVKGALARQLVPRVRPADHVSKSSKKVGKRPRKDQKSTIKAIQ